MVIDMVEGKVGSEKMKAAMFENPKINVKLKLSALWVVVMINMAFADILTLYIPELLQDIVNGTTSVEITQELMLVMAIIIEISIMMIFLSLILKPKINRLINIIAGVITIVFVVGGGSLLPHYILFGTIEVACALLIIWFAWKWPKVINEKVGGI